MLVHLGPLDRTFRHRGQHMRRFQGATLDLRRIKSLNEVDECTVPFFGGIEVRTEAAVDKDIDDVAERDEQFKIETLDQQRQDVLCADSFEAFLGAVPILVLFLVPFQQMIEFVRVGKLTPQFVYQLQSLGPALMAIAANHVVR